MAYCEIDQHFSMPSVYVCRRGLVATGVTLRWWHAHASTGSTSQGGKFHPVQRRSIAGLLLVPRGQMPAGILPAGTRVLRSLVPPAQYRGANRCPVENDSTVTTGARTANAGECAGPSDCGLSHSPKAGGASRPPPSLQEWGRLHTSSRYSG